MVCFHTKLTDFAFHSISQIAFEYECATLVQKMTQWKTCRGTFAGELSGTNLFKAPGITTSRSQLVGFFCKLCSVLHELSSGSERQLLSECWTGPFFETRTIHTHTAPYQNRPNTHHYVCCTTAPAHLVNCRNFLSFCQNSRRVSTEITLVKIFPPPKLSPRKVPRRE